MPRPNTLALTHAQYRLGVFWLVVLKRESNFLNPQPQPLHLQVTERDIVGYLTYGSWESPESLGKTANQKQKYEKSHFSLSFKDSNNSPYCVLFNRTFLLYRHPLS